MGDKNDVFERFDSNSREVMARTKSFFMRNFPYLMLLGNILFEVLTRLFRIGFTTPFTPDFWASLFINTLSSTLAFACFVFYAEKKKKDNWKDYLDNCKIWETKSANVRLNLFDKFLTYCKAEYERECKERRIALIVNHTQIVLSDWEEKYSKLKPRAVLKLVKTGELTLSDAIYVIMANKHPRLKPINPLLILAGMKVRDINDAGRSDTSSVKSVVFRPIPVILMSIAGSMFAGQFIGVSDSSVFFNMLYTAGMICVSALAGHAKGTANAEKHNADIKGRVLFIERFEKTEQ